MSNNESYSGIAIFLTGIILGITAAVFVGERSIDALRIATTVFSILAGMLIAIISILGDPRILFPGSKRVASFHRRHMENVLRKYTWLLYTYLILILLAFIISLDIELINNNLIESSWLYKFTIGFATAAMIWSLNLPSVIYQAQVERYDREIEKMDSDD